MSIELISFLFVAVFVVILLTGLPLAFATGAVAVFFAVVLFGWPGLTLIVGRARRMSGPGACRAAWRWRSSSPAR